jgi:dual specificity phosphatase 12
LRRYQALKAARITHVVSALRLPLDEALFEPYRHLVVELDDVEDEDILQHFATSNAFIQEGLDAGGGVLVHW